MHANKWGAGTVLRGSHKTSTCVLFDKHGEFDSFGFDAETKYHKLTMNSDHWDWFFFSRFKMSLYTAVTRKFYIRIFNEHMIILIRWLYLHCVIKIIILNTLKISYKLVLLYTSKNLIVLWILLYLDYIRVLKLSVKSVGHKSLLNSLSVDHTPMYV